MRWLMPVTSRHRFLPLLAASTGVVAIAQVAAYLGAELPWCGLATEYFVLAAVSRSSMDL